MQVQQLVEYAEGLYHDTTFSVCKDWKEKHGRAAIGYLPIYVPRELIDAAGMLPVGLLGGRGLVEIIRGDAFYQSYICQIPRSTVELALMGRYDFIDGFLFPSTCDVIRNLSGVWKILFPDKYSHYLDVPQNFEKEIGGRFYERELRHILRDLETIAKKKVSDDDLRQSIASYNDNRHAISDLFALRNAEPWRALATESYLMLYAGCLLPVREHTELIRRYIAAVKQADRPMRDNARVIVTGAFCEQPPLGLVRTLELAGCYIVWDDMSIGRRWLQADVSLEGDPIESLSDAFLRHSITTAVKYEPQLNRTVPLRRLVEKNRAEGVVFAAPSFCDPALLEQPMLTQALDRAGIPWTAFKYAENLGQFQVIREQAGTFADSIKLWSET